ncbi:hypothetical protein SAMN06295974_3881 [Plantibacter flavus]|uniref:Uncharacterized protein n=1 Tax=Plantibacter flavus TaxID=150123 RepID=A0A3N2BLR2_9MICO|nr:hypothetical protein [Plantibacter flavus]ROR75974.1 hypothetical protein EDD42_3925 [Plantibacter flavus]SMG49695.1 hypothetical protein SAMN06295974_3881 [Plantibacter flavus]
MVDMRKEVHGANSLKDVDLVVISYDNRVASKDGVVTTHYLDVRLHPEDKRAKGQTSLALVSKKDEKSPTGYNNSSRYTASQFASISEAAGANVTDLTDSAGTVVGKIYGVKADLLINNGELIANSKTLAPSELSVEPNAAGQDIRTQIFASMKAAKDAKAAAAPAVAAEAAPAEAASAAPAKPKTARKPRVAKPELATVAAGAPAADQPELG